MVVTMNCPMGFPGGSDGKESVCNARRPEFDPLVRKIPWKREWLPTPVFLGLPGGSDGKEPACNPGDLGSIPQPIKKKKLLRQLSSAWKTGEKKEWEGVNHSVV